MLETPFTALKSIGPDKWKENSYNKIRKVNKQIKTIENSPWNIQNLDVTLVHKELCAGLSNQEALKHARSVRNIVQCLQESIVLNNEEIKKLNILKQANEKYLYNIQVDQQINRDSRKIRDKRPQDEKKISDGTDDLLIVEKTQLLNIKYHLEMTLRTIQEHLLNISLSRTKLINIQKERSRVLDLLCQRGPNMHEIRSSLRRSNSNVHTKGNLQINLDQSQADPLSAFTPAVKDVIREAKNFCQESQKFREQISNNLEKVQNYREKSNGIVNSSFIHKLSETEQLKNQLQFARIRARSASNKARRWRNFAEKSAEFNQGPHKYQDLLVRERLDRPVIKIFQRHPGNQLPEAQELIQADNRLRSSVLCATANIDHLHAIDAELDKDIRSKSLAMDVDKSTLFWRRYKSQEMHCK